MTKIKDIFHNTYSAFSRFRIFLVIFIVVSLILTLSLYLLPIQLFFNSDLEILFIFIVTLFAAGLIVISILVAYQINKIILDHKKNNAGSQLHWRIAILFGGISILPSTILAAFGLFIVDYSFRGWFSDRISTAINESVKVAEDYLSEHTSSVRGSILEMVNDINREAPKLVSNPKNLDNYLSTQAAIRNLSEAILLNSSKMVLARSQFAFSIALNDLDDNIFNQAQKGDLIILRSDANNKIRGLVKINRLVDVYLYAGRFLEPSVLDAIDRTKLASDQYQFINIESTNLQISFGVLFFLVALFLLLLALWIGLILANSIIKPLSSVISVANIARTGNLDVRVENNLGIEEISRLGLSFNKMLDEISKNRKELISANYQINQRREFTETILSGVSSGVIGLDADGKVNLPNSKSLELLKISEQNFYGQKFIKLFPEFSSLFNEVKNNKNQNNQEQIKIDIDNKVRTFLTRISKEVTEGKLSGYVITFDDITELLSAQNKAAWSDIAQRIAHEIRNPLTPLQLSVEKIYNKFKPTNPEDLKTFNNYLETIQRQVDDIGNLVGEFSSFARMPSINLYPGNLDQVISTQLSLFKISNNNINWNYINKIPKDLKIKLDSQKIRQALTNIFQNSVDSINENRSDSNGIINISADLKKAKIVLIIEDNGVGFPKNKDDLTLPYVTLRKKGTGLGLSIVHRIIEEHNGKLVLDDSDLGGAKIIIEFLI